MIEKIFCLIVKNLSLTHVLTAGREDQTYSVQRTIQLGAADAAAYTAAAYTTAAYSDATAAAYSLSCCCCVGEDEQRALHLQRSHLL